MKIILVMAITLDGKIAKDKQHFPNWTSREDKQFFAQISKKHKVVIFGENTFDTFKKPLKERLNVVFAKEKKEKIENVMWVSGKVKPVLNKLEKLGYKSAVLGGGAFLNTLFLKEKLIDEMYISINPKIFGKGISLFSEDFDIDLKLVDIKKLNKDSFIVRYKIIYN
jgi:dihydrofolate reductase